MNYELNKFDTAIIEIINSQAKGFTRHSARNAIRHLEKSWLLRAHDPEMAAFRAITAEEEAATSLFIALKEKGYENSKKIKFKNHTYKQAVEPFFQAIGKFFGDTSSLPNFPFAKNFSLAINSNENPKRFELRFPMSNGDIVTPIPPLHFSVSLNGQLYAFEKELLEVTSGDNRQEVVDKIKEKANLRNHLLYSSHDGIAGINHDITPFLQSRQKVVMTFLRVVCLIFPYKEKSLFVQQALNAFLIMLGDIEGDIENPSA